ncbi:MAG: fructose-bisphosphate aldolase [Candidatus Eremiobacteraeota bacterium]|nr:fructose-bisphosphate aldolase [Candidatus Eremiobacteraeota bacterium]MBV9647843.1 fructose-bisphosphate aldolase [Candidatus Eremiobacteraeota bacterium]
MIQRPTFDEMNLSTGKRARLHRLMYEHGPANGTLMLLPIDQGLEHGPVDFFDNPVSLDTEWVLRLAVEGGFSGIAYHVGLAEKYQRPYAGRVPLILKINGKTNIPPDDEAFSPLTSSVEDAVRLGADAVGYTLYVGSPRQDDDLRQCNDVRRACERLGMPFIIWSYPRGSAVKAKGGQDSLYAIDYAARVACEVGADIVKLNMPKWDSAKASSSPRPYNTMETTDLEGLSKVVKSAGRTLVLVSGGSKESDDDMLHKARVAMEAGCVGLIFGRNMWQRDWDDALTMSSKLHELMQRYGQ